MADNVRLSHSFRTSAEDNTEKIVALSDIENVNAPKLVFALFTVDDDCMRKSFMAKASSMWAHT